MNDFTKEEIKWLYDVVMLRAVCENNPIADKIQEMIDNYCEHEFKDYKDEISAVPFCVKCNKAIL